MEHGQDAINGVALALRPEPQRVARASANQLSTCFLPPCQATQFANFMPPTPCFTVSERKQRHTARQQAQRANASVQYVTTRTSCQPGSAGKYALKHYRFLFVYVHARWSDERQ